MICSYFNSLNFFRQPFWSHGGVISRKLLIKSRNQNIFEKFKLNRNLKRIPFKMMYNMSMLRHRFSNELWGGGGGTTFLSYSVKVCTIISHQQYMKDPKIPSFRATGHNTCKIELNVYLFIIAFKLMTSSKLNP